MDFQPNETEAMIRDVARDFAQKKIAKEAASIDAEARFPTSLLRGLADLGLLGVNVPAALGGAEAGPVAYALAMREIAAACASTAVAMAVTNMVAEVITRFGDAAQRERHVPKLTSGEYVTGAFALSEPEAGSDPGSMRTTARLDGDAWVLDGTKQWITSGGHAGVIVVWARTEPVETHPGTRGISCLLVERGAPGLEVGRAEDKMGLRGSNTVPLSFTGCRVPRAALLGERGQGFKIAMMALDGGRIGISAQALGIATAAFDASVAYAKERRQFGHPIADFQAIQWMLADGRTELDAAWLLCLRAADRKGRGLPFSREASMSKLFATEAAGRICDRAVQIHGGYGYVKEYAVERNYRDVRVSRIYEGTSEIQRTVIARETLR